MNSDQHSDYDSLLNDVSRQMASSQLSRRNSRSSKRRSATPSRRSIRVEKPSTAHSSPHPPERRRTTSSVKQYTTLDDHYNAMFGSPEPEQHRELEKTVIRPVSWHPSASRAISGFETANRPTSEIPAVPNVYMDSNTSWEPSYTAYMNDNASRHMSQEGSTDLETAIMNYFAGVSTYPLEVQFDSSMDSEVSQHMNVTENWLSAQHAQMQQAWSHTPVDPSEATELHNDFLPIQATQGGKQPSLRSQRSKDSAKSLIGMGLYDPPEDPVRTWQTQYDGYRSWLAPDLVPSSGKGLKLEETFEPPPDHDEDCEEDNGSSEDEVQEEPPSLDDPQLHVTVASSQPTNLAGQSFFFEDDEAYHNDWWYSQGKNPSAQDAVMDCNWI